MFIYIQPSEMKWTPGKQITKKEFKDDLHDEFVRYMAKVYRDEVKRAIKEQRYKGNWKPLSRRYLKYKRTHGLSTNIWEATGTLVESISYWKQGERYVVGVRPRKTYPGTDVTILSVIRRMEYGDNKVPARPLFRPIAKYLQKNIRRYWEKFLESKGLK